MLSTSILYCNKLDERQLQQMAAETSIDNNSPLTSPHRPHSTANGAKGAQPPPQHLNHHPNVRPASSTTLTSSVIHPSELFSDVATNATTNITSTPTLAGSSSTANKASNRFQVRYLGCNSCDPKRHRLDGGIASYQKPLLDLYSTVLRRSVVLRSLYAYSIAAVNQVADVSSHGIVVAERDRFAKPKLETNNVPKRPNSSVSENVNDNPSTSQDVLNSSSHSSPETVVTKVITPLSNILLFAAVRFQHRSRSTSKCSAGGRRGGRRQVVGVAFVPLSCSEAVLDKNAFVTLPAKQRFLLGLPHPPLFACVLQKVNAVHRLECHLFLCLTADDAIRMCASVAEHRRRGGAIGRLQLPMPGTMGSYSYAPSLSSTSALGSRMAPSSSSAISVISNRSSDISSSATTFIRNSSSHAFSDIEEGQEGDEGGRMRRTSRQEEAQLRPPFAITQQHSTSALKMAALFQGRTLAANSNGNHYHPHHPSSSERDLPVQRIHDQQRTTVNKHNNSNGHLFNGAGDSLSWAEDISSISSAFISTKSEPPASRDRSLSQQQAAVAQRDYRLQSYKCTQNLVLPELQKSNCDSSTTGVSIVSSASKRKQKPNAVHCPPLPETTVKVLETTVDSPSAAAAANNRLLLSAVGDELQTNRLFAKASAIASQESSQGVRAPSFDHQQTTNGLYEDSSAFIRASSTPRFFGDTIRGRPKTAPKPQVKAAHLKNLRDQSALNSREFIDGDRNRDKLNLKNGFVRENGNNRSQHPSSNLQSTISNSIFFDEEISSSSSKSGGASSAQKGAVNQKIKDQSAGDLQKRQRQPDKLKSVVPKLPVIEPVPSVVLYLPTETSNVGVKCFNKSTPVDRWSTMMPATGASNASLQDQNHGCELCSFELEAAVADDCEECCKLCQSLEHETHKQQRPPAPPSIACPQCLADEDHPDDDDIILDEAILQNFNGGSSTLPDQSQHQHHNQHQLTASEDGSRRRRRREEQSSSLKDVYRIGDADVEAINSTKYLNYSKAIKRKKTTTFFGRIRQLGSSIFGSSKTSSGALTVAPSSTNRCRSLWGRSSLKKLKGRRTRVLSGRGLPPMAKEHQVQQQLHQVNRIFLPPATTDYSSSRVYSEHYLKPPLPPLPPPKKSQSSKTQTKEQEETVVNQKGDCCSAASRRQRSVPKDLQNNNKVIGEKSTLKNRASTPRTEATNGGMKPFFISHPSEFNPAQVLSISSDSGMEEYDCHSSSEHSPLAAAANQQKKVNGQMADNRSNSKASKMTGAKLTRSSPVKPQQQSQLRPTSGAKIAPTSTNNNTGHWSETNLQNELGYMP